MATKKSINSKISIGVQIARSDYEKMKQIAREQDVSISQIVRRALRREMDEKKSAA